MKWVAHVWFFLIMIVPPAVRGQDHSPVLNLTEWEYQWGRSDSSGPHDDAWKITTLGFDFPSRDGDSVLWLRTHLPTENWTDPTLLLMHPDHYFSLYLDDSLRYTFGEEEMQQSGRTRMPPRHVILLSGPLGGNTVTLKLVSDHRLGLGEARIGSMADVIEYIGIADLDQVVLGSLFVLVGLAALGILLQYRRDKKTIVSFALLSINLGLVTLFQTETVEIAFRIPYLFDYLNLSFVFLLPVSLAYFFEQVFGAGYKRMVRRIWQIHLAYAVVTISLAMWIGQYIDNPFFIMTFASALFLMFTAIKAAHGGNPEARIFTVGMVIFTVLLFRDLLMGLGVLPGFRLLHPWGTLVFIGALIVIIARRFTEAQRQLQEKIVALGISEHRLLFMVENLPRGAIYVDGNRIYLNKAAEEITGYSRDAMTTIDEWARLMFGDRHETVLQGYEEERKRYFPKPITLSIIRKDGQLRLIEFVGYRDEPGEIWLLHDVTDRKKAEKALKASEAELRKLAGHLQDVRETERTHIAREIHDELGQYLTGLKMDISMMEDVIQDQPDEKLRKQLLGKLARTSELLDNTVQSVRKIAADLRPIVLDNLGLLAAIEWQAEDFQNRTGITCECHLPTDALQLDRDRATAIFRILQESLTNVMRHAQANRVSIAFGRENGQYYMEIKDNGRGIRSDDLNKKKSFGVIGIKERVALLGGMASIVGEPGRGTTVNITIPIESMQREERS